MSHSTRHRLYSNYEAEKEAMPIDVAVLRSVPLHLTDAQLCALGKRIYKTACEKRI